MSRVDYPSLRSPGRRYSPIRSRLNRSRSRERYARRSPLLNSRNRLPVHQRLDRSPRRSIEKRVSYPSKYELDKSRNVYRRSRSPRRRQRSSSRSSRRSRSKTPTQGGRRRSCSRRSRSRSKDGEDRRKFLFLRDYSNLGIESSDFLNKPSQATEDYLRSIAHFNNELASTSGNYLQSGLLEKPGLLEKLPLLEKPPLISFDSNTFNDDYYENPMNAMNPINAQLNQLSHQINQLSDNSRVVNNQFNSHQFKAKLNSDSYINQTIPETEQSFHASNLTRSIRDRLDVVFPSGSSNALLETPSHYLNSNHLNNNHLNNVNNNPLINNHHLNNRNSPLRINSSGNSLNTNSSGNHLDSNGYYGRTLDTDLRTANSNHLIFKDSLLGNGPSDHQHLNNHHLMLNSGHEHSTEKCMFNHLGCPVAISKELVGKHELDCLYNPKNVKAYCNKCRLVVCPEHDCVSELRSELQQTKIKTNWCQNTVKLTSTSLLSHDASEQAISIHYCGEKEIVKQIKVGSLNAVRVCNTARSARCTFSTFRTFRTKLSNSLFSGNSRTNKLDAKRLESLFLFITIFVHFNWLMKLSNFYCFILEKEKDHLPRHR